MIAIYARQSVDKKDSISIEGQIDRCVVETNNETYKVFIDKGYSGKNTDRPNFIEMMQAVNNNSISKVIVYKIDRISRAIVDFGKIMEELDSHNVEFVSCTEKFDTSTPIGRAMLNIIMVFAQLERETIQLRIKDNYYQRGEQGYYLGGRAPFGYNKIETTLKGKKTYTFEENIEQSNIVKELYNKYGNTDCSLGTLMKEINNRKIMTNFNNPWSSVALGRLLRNPIYVKANSDIYTYLQSKGATINNEIEDFVGENGCYVYAERKSITTSKFTDLSTSFITIGLHTGLISPNLWLSCQTKLDNNKQIGNSGKGTHSWLSGLMKCGYCGFAVNVVNNCRGHSYINCGGRKLKVCYNRKKVITLKMIEDSTEFQLLKYINSKLSENFEENKKEESTELNSFKIQVIQIEERINNLISKLEYANDITMDYINNNIKKLDNEKKDIQKKIISLTHNNIKVIRSDDEMKDIILNWNDYSIKKRKEIASAYIEKVIITDDLINVVFR